MPISSNRLLERDSLSVLNHRRPELNRHSSATGSFTYLEKKAKFELSLGWELEANSSAVKVPGGVLIQSDGSVDDDAMEYVVYPTLVNSPTYVLGLLKDLVHSPGLNTNRSCGYHVHMAPKGVSLKVMQKWAIICQELAMAVQTEAFAAVPESRQDNIYCHRIDKVCSGVRFSANKYSNPIRYNWLNVVEMFRPGGIRTVEVRLLGNTHRWKYLLAWTNFSMQLGKSAWNIMSNPFDLPYETGRLKIILKTVADEVRPIEKRNEPIPESVYRNLTLLGIDSSKWDRPLSKLLEAETVLGLVPRQTYSDAQPIIESEERDDESDYCEHGVDRDNYICERCDHTGGNCLGFGECQYCRQTSHYVREYCGYIGCIMCESRDLIPREVA